MKLLGVERELRLLIESVADGFISEMEEVCTANNLPTSREDIAELIKQALDRVV
jgi:hypothetical protein